ncbi:MAG TPA: hypothetical protein VIL88_04260 [Devosia sp.]|jgi:hypothetical protein|uniref:hypothetical protein n=1 Tax=Devosia sp. TaxID=1871048 RepID=UPI002F926B9F
MKTIITLSAVLFGLSAAPALAEAQCYQSDQFLVIAQERVDEVGTDFIIRPPVKGKIACRFEVSDDDQLLGDPGDPLHFEQLVGQYLILTRSTGPQGDLVIYDLAADLWMPLLDVRAEDEITVTDNSVTYWQQLIRGTATNCPSFAENQGMGLGSMIYEERVLDLETVTVSATGQTRCSSTQ